MPIDPVCHMEVEPEDAAGSSEYQGQTFYFCAAACKRAFDQAPERYLKAQPEDDEGGTTAPSSAELVSVGMTAGTSLIGRALSAVAVKAPEEGSRLVRLDITGMTCASCVSRVERALKHVDGVRQAQVNLATEKATVTLEPGQVEIAQLIAAVEDIG